MEFSKPSVFYYLFLLVIPVLIHLFNLRKHEKIYFSSINFLKKIIQKNKGRQEIKRWIVLLTRIFSISLIILAFSLPHIKNTDTIKSDRIGFYIDNSFSMDRFDAKNIKLITHAKNNVKTIVNQLPENQKIFILTNNVIKKHQKWYSPKEAINIIDEIKISGQEDNIKKTINQYIQVIDTNKINTLYLFSDFQNKEKLNSSIKTDLINFKIGVLSSDKQDNISLDSCYFKTPIRKKNKIETLFVDIYNHSSIDKTVKSKLIINGKQKTTNNITIPKNSLLTQKFNYINPIEYDTVNGLIKIEDQELEFDNNLYFSYSTNHKIEVAVIYEKTLNSYLENVFSDSLFKFSSFNLNQFEYESFGKYKLLVLDQIGSITNSMSDKIKNYIENGGNIFIFLKKDVNINNYNKFFKLINTDLLSDWVNKVNNIEYINYQNSLFQNVFVKKNENINLPIVNGYFSYLENKYAQRRDILSFMNESPFLAEYIYKKGHIFLCFSDLKLTNTNFPEHALFIPCLYNAALINFQNNKIYYYIKDETIIEKTELKQNDILLLKKHSTFEMIPSITISNQNTLLNFYNKIPDANNYILTKNNNIVEPISFNYSRIESKTDFFTHESIKNKFPNNTTFMELEDNISEKLVNSKKENRIQYFFIISAIILLIIELILLRIWKI